MKIFSACCLNLLILLNSTLVISKDVYVEGYYRSDGTFVQGHYRTKPNNTINDNYSTKGNINPYTGKEGWVPMEQYNSIQPINRNDTNLSNPYAINKPSLAENNLAILQGQNPVKSDSFFDELNLFSIVFLALLGLGCIQLLIYEPYKHTKEFVSSPKQYIEKYGISETIWNFIRGVCIALFWAFVLFLLIHW